MTTSTNWPDFLPCVLRANYSYVRKDIVLRTELDTGRMRMRRRASDGPAVVQVHWIMKAWQAAYFERWWKLTLEAGSLPFNMNISVGSGYQPHECRFLAPYTMDGLERRDLYRISGQLEIVQIALWSQEITDLVEEYIAEGLSPEELFAFMDLFETYVNVDLPGSEMAPGGIG